MLEPGTISVKERASAIVTQAILDVDAKALLVEKEGKRPDEAVFFAWPLDREAELLVLMRCFQDLSCKVYHLGYAGRVEPLPSKIQAIMSNPYTSGHGNLGNAWTALHAAARQCSSVVHRRAVLRATSVGRACCILR